MKTREEYQVYCIRCEAKVTAPGSPATCSKCGLVIYFEWRAPAAPRAS